MSYSIAIVGATGLVGRTMLQVLEERNFPIEKLTLLASKNSAGKKVRFRGKSHTIQELTPDSFAGVQIALFSAGGSVSRHYCPIAAAAGAVAIDNSSAWRMDKKTPLVVPEVNPGAALKHRGIIANPNCSTIQLVVALKPLHESFGLKRVVVSTYQAISGAGQSGVDQLMAELKGKQPAKPKFPRPAAFNTIFHSFLEGSDYSEEENKMMNETRKIMELPKLAATMTCVRIPTIAAHAESVNAEFSQPVTPAKARKILQKASGVIVMDDPVADLYPTVLDAEGRDEVFVGRIRRDASQPNTLNLWVVGNNVRKGAATNAVQIAELLVEKGLVQKN
ncbi:MAG: aspartate-semialdehyde dehydrogenase [Chlorobi bacterium]|nr:MAG: aspartate-semialdehyde dehydrogenase [Chlorobi bacterium OLB7]MBK8911869.1 aspartate-semialdehyde dehydrogenase [Chlorobiota bacterium]MBX7215489.1 aspartate-semialdehyde dehydrogenase [Candidatus Kapabacteria bacterium]